MALENAAPAGYHTLQPYLIFKNTMAAIDFYKRAFNAEERLCMKDKDGRVGHAELVFGDSCMMMADEHPAVDAYSFEHYGGSPVRMMIYVPNCDAGYRQALEAGATSLREPTDQPYGDRSAGVRDPFGYTWHLATQIREMSKEELEGLMQKAPQATSA
jgi:PhnB protein